MPLFFQQVLDGDTRLGVWRIKEAEPFFAAHVPLQRSITHKHKRLQHLAGRFLLTQLFPGFPIDLIRIADTRKPFLQDELFHFSISHCGDFAAAIASRSKRVGVDIELVAPKTARVQQKFMSPAEVQLVATAQTDAEQRHPQTFSNAHALPTLVWSCKEALFKWYGLGEVDFKNHMQLQQISQVPGELFQTTIRFKKVEDRLLGLRSFFIDDLCLSWVVT